MPDGLLYEPIHPSTITRLSYPDEIQQSWTAGAVFHGAGGAGLLSRFPYDE